MAPALARDRPRLALAARIRDLYEADTRRRGPVCPAPQRNAVPGHWGWEGFKPANAPTGGASANYIMPGLYPSP
jgi:hypothetical protein